MNNTLHIHPTGYPPKTQTPTHREDDLPRSLVISIVAHASLVLIVMMKTLIFPSSPTPLIPTLRVDLVGLPDQLKSEQGRTAPAPSKELQEALRQAENAAKEIQSAKKSKPIPNPIEAPAPNEMVVKPKPSTPQSDPARLSKKEEKKRLDKMTGALARMKALQKISSETLEDSKSSESTGSILKGNKISLGHSTSGEFTENAESGYLEGLRDRLAERWALPVWLARQNLSAQVRVWIDRRGQLLRFEYKRPSGNLQFDEAVKKTLLSSQPFPAPPKNLTGQLESNGLLIGFPL